MVGVSQIVTAFWVIPKYTAGDIGSYDMCKQLAQSRRPTSWQRKIGSRPAIRRNYHGLPVATYIQRAD